MQIQFWQIIILSAYAFWTIIDAISFDMALNKPVVAGFITGLVLGDIKTGLFIGGTLQLLILGIGTYGGASIPDYTSGAIIGTVIAVTSQNLDAETAIGIAVPVGLLLVQLDVLARFTNSYFQHRADAYAEIPDTAAICRMNIMGMIPWGLSRMLPVLLVLLFGRDIVDALLQYSPKWLIDGLRVAGGMLPVVGISILLRYVPTKKYISFLIIGFALAAFLKVSMVGVALFGLAAGLLVYKNKVEAEGKVVTVGGADGDE